VPAELVVPLVPRAPVTVPVHAAVRPAHLGRGDLDGTGPPRAVRNLFVENATRVVLVRDRRPSTALLSSWSPGLCNPYACRTVGRLLAASARRARCAFREEDDQLAHALEALAIGRLGRGSFVFLVSDFLRSPPEDIWREALERGWDIVPVVLQSAVSRRAETFDLFDRLDLDPIRIARHDDMSIWRAFYGWSEARRARVRACA
jgi:hypothetical protein